MKKWKKMKEKQLLTVVWDARKLQGKNNKELEKMKPYKIGGEVARRRKLRILEKNDG